MKLKIYDFNNYKLLVADVVVEFVEVVDGVEEFDIVAENINCTMRLHPNFIFE